jgi:FkbM family methyltransferase
MEVLLWILAGMGILVGLYLFSRRRVKHTAKREVPEYGFEIDKFNLKDFGEVEFAQWLHPKEKRKILEDELLENLSKYIKTTDFVIDIGAHGGDTVIPYALLAGVEGKVLALEPNPYVYKILEENAKLNAGKVSIDLEMIAATEDDGEFVFLYSDEAFCNGGNLDSIENKTHGHRYELKIQGKNLSNLLRSQYKDRLDKLSFVKTDTEGYDKEVLESIQDILRDFRPVVLAEVLKRLNLDERLRMYNLMRSLDYNVYKTDAWSLEKEVELNEDNLMEWLHYDILCIPKEQDQVASTSKKTQEEATTQA